VEYNSTDSLTSALDGGEWSASRPGRFNPRKRAPGSHWIVNWVGPRASLDAAVRRKIPSPYRDSNLISSSPTDTLLTMNSGKIAQTGARVAQSVVIFLFSTSSRLYLGGGGHPAPYPVGTRGLLPRRVKRPEREDGHSPPSSAGVKNVWSYTSIPPKVFMSWCLVKHGIRLHDTALGLSTWTTLRYPKLRLVF
jgi:hypothetical protein